jgi:hypothetical protein
MDRLGQGTVFLLGPITDHDANYLPSGKDGMPSGCCVHGSSSQTKNRKDAKDNNVGVTLSIFSTWFSSINERGFPLCRIPRTKVAGWDYFTSKVRFLTSVPSTITRTT